MSEATIGDSNSIASMSFWILGTTHNSTFMDQGDVTLLHPCSTSKVLCDEYVYSQLENLFPQQVLSSLGAYQFSSFAVDDDNGIVLEWSDLATRKIETGYP